MPKFAHKPATIRLGDLEVSRLGFGAMQLSGPMVWGEPRDPERARRVLRRAVELGVNLIDTAWYYGPHVVNRLIAEALYPYPKDLVIATKLGGKRNPDKSWAAAIRPDELKAGCEEDLKTLKLDAIAVVHLRWMDHGVPFNEALDALIDLRKQGKLRHIALSNVNVAQLTAALERTPIVAVQNLYNVAAGESRLGELGHAEVRGQEQLLETCTARGVAFLPFFPLAIPGGAPLENAALKRIAAANAVSEAQIAIAWLLARSPVLLPIPGTGSPEHLEDNCAARELQLSTDELAAISRDRG